MRQAVWIGIGVLLLGVWSCASPLVGLHCAAGFERCGDECIDTSSDLAHCGGCGMSCPGGDFQCVDGRCALELSDGGLDFDATLPDGGPRDGSVDAGGVDSGGDSGGGNSGGPMVLPPPAKPRCDGTLPADECRCGVGELKCGNVCVQPSSDPDHCGACDNACDPGDFCASGSCVPTCDPPLTRCGGLCLDLDTDPANCGSCGNVCSTKLCADGMCVGAPAGHVVVVGHDYQSTNTEQSKIPPGAVTLNNNFNPAILGYSAHSDPATVGRINATLTRGLGIDPGDITEAVLEAIPLQLADHDVIVFYPQVNISQADLLTKVIAPLEGVLPDFLARGGVVLVFEGNGSNEGTWQIVAQEQLVSITGRSMLSGGRIQKTDQGFRDFVNGVTVPYRAERRTYGFDGVDVDDPGVLLYHEGQSLPVVVHNIFVE